MITSVYSSLVLGTVQLGLPYGVANKTGQPDQAMAIDIVRTAWENGIGEFDTAQDYGLSEQLLGISFAKLGISKKVKVISKISPKLDHCDTKTLSKALNASLKKLGIPCLYGLMLHKEDLISRWSDGLGDILQSFVLSGKVKNIGISVYTPDTAIKALNINGLEIIQVPSNILDKRFEKQGVFKLAVEKKKQIYIRSIFLQGLLLLNPDEIPENMTFAREEVRKVHAFAAQVGINVKEACLGYVIAKWPHAKVLIGVETSEQIRENINLAGRIFPKGFVQQADAVIGSIDERVVNPTLWTMV